MSRGHRGAMWRRCVKAGEHVAAAGVGLTRLYQRRLEVETEIAALPEGTDAEFHAAVARATALETIVHGVRRAKRASDDAGAAALAELLIDRMAPILASEAWRLCPRSEADRKDVVQAATEKIWHKIFDLSPQQECWEVHFRRMVKFACSDAADDLRKQRVHEEPFERSEDGSWDEETNVEDRDEDVNPEQRVISESLELEALSHLDGNVRRAFYLKYRHDLTEKMIASVLGVSDRTVRTYLRRAEQTLRAAFRQDV
jgi:RNA polymerase sigma factor (sigma-70 family)